MNDEELTALLKEMVAAAVSIASNVELIAQTLHRVESGEEWSPGAREYEGKD
jgi:hypothetical protein